MCVALCLIYCMWYLDLVQTLPIFVEHHTPGSYEKARLRFAHAETVVPFSCLLGLFLEGFGEFWVFISILSMLLKRCSCPLINMCMETWTFFPQLRNYLLVLPILYKSNHTDSLHVYAGLEFAQIQNEQALELPPKPPQKRSWRGSTVAPFGGNNMLVLYSCPKHSSKYFVQVLHNEVPVPLPVSLSSAYCWNILLLNMTMSTYNFFYLRLQLHMIWYWT